MVFERTKKYSNIKVKEEELTLYIAKINALMKEKKPFLDNDFTLAKLSKGVSMPLYLTSHVLNEGLNTNFSDYINSFRIEESKELLVSQEYKHIKISEIAFQCGFNSLSTFNSHFKRSNNSTPSQYRNSHYSSD